MNKISINDAKLIRSLTIKKYREEYKKFIIEGEKLVLETVNHKYSYINKLYCTDEFEKKYYSLLISKGIEYQSVTMQELNKVSNFKTSDSALIIADQFEKIEINPDSDFNIIVYLDDISDPGNMGTILRSAEWFGIDYIVASGNSVDFYNPKVVQASMGSILRIKFVIMDYGELLERMKNADISTYGMMLEGESVYTKEFKHPMLLVVGNESNGISEEVISKIRHKITIPGSSTSVESLNAAVSASVVFSEIFRRQAMTIN